MSTARIDKLHSHVNFQAPKLFHPSGVACAPEYDYVIVGAGSAGCALAARLAEKFPLRTILLVDAGGSNQQFRISQPFLRLAELQNSDVDFAYRTTRQPLQQNRQSYWPRGKVLGGSSSINFMLASRGDSRGYDKWANELGCPGWSYKDVEPYFRKLESYSGKQSGSGMRGRQGPIKLTDNRTVKFSTKPLMEAFVRGCEEVGIPEVEDYNLADELGQGACAHFQTTIDKGRRCDAATGYLFGRNGAFSRCANLHCLGHHQAARVLFDAEDDKIATGVEFIGGLVIRARVEVLLCAGAVGSPQLLMLSGVGPRQHLESKNVHVVRDLPGVGQNLKDHVTVSQQYKIRDTCAARFSPDSALEVGREMLRYALFGDGVASTSWVQGTAFFNSTRQRETDAHAIQLYVTPFISNDEELGKRMFGFDRAAQEMQSKASSSPVYAMEFLPALVQPKSIGFIELQSNNPSDHPVIEPRYLSHPDDEQVMLEAWNLVKRIAKTRAMAHVMDKAVLDDSIHLALDSDEYALGKIRRDLLTMYHPCCTCKMGPASDSMAVLDPNTLKVRGFANLRVVDCSSFPDIPAANTNLAAIMLGERAADFIFRENNNL